MATLVLGVAGTYVGGPVGGMLGATLGSYLDNRYIMPYLFPPEPLYGARLGDIPLQSASEGSALGVVLGTGAKLAGTVVWLSPMKEVARTSQVGGKGGSSATQKTTNYTYYVDMAVAVCEGEITRIRQVYANGQLIYNDDNIVDETGGCIIAVVQKYFSRQIFNGQIIQTSKKYMRITSPVSPSQINLGQYGEGINLQITGCTNPSNNVNFKVSAVGLSGAGDYYIDIANNGAIAEANSIRLQQTRPKIDKKCVDAITTYTGSLSQTADPIIQSYEGVANTPAFRGVAYVVLENLSLSQFGNSIPQLTFVVERHVSPTTVKVAIDDVIVRTELLPADYDASACSALDFSGLAFSGLNPTTPILQQLMLVYNLSSQVVDGKIMIFPKASAETVVVDEDDLASHEPGSDVDRPFTIVETAGADLPREVTVKYLNINNDYQTGSQKEVRVDTPSKCVSVLETNIVLNATQARKLAMEKLWTPWLNKSGVELSLPPDYIYIAENDLLSISIADLATTLVMRVMNVTRGSNSRIEVQCVIDDSMTSTFTPPVDTSTLVMQSLYTPPDMILFLMDTAPLRDDDLNSYGFYYAACPYNPDARWAGAELQKSFDDLNYSAEFPYQIPASCGTTVGVLATGTADVWDRGSTVDIVMNYGVLSSTTEELVEAGANRILIGNEIVGFADATLVSDHTYRLTNLIRGLRNTQQHMSTHLAGERCVLLEKYSVGRLETNVSQIGSTIYCKVVPVAALASEMTAEEMVPNGNALRPFSPVHFKSVRRDTTYGLSWIRRTRANIVPFSDNDTSGTVPLLETAEVYEIDFYQGATLKATRTVTADTVLDYTSALQTADGFTTGQAITAIIYQISDRVGRGWPSETLAVGNAF